MNRCRFIVAFTLVILGMTLAARIMLDQESKPAETAPTTAAHGRNTGAPASRGHPGTKNHPIHARPAGQRSPELTVRSGPKPDDAGDGGISSPEERAARVETHSRARLVELDRRLHLTSDQKRRIFPLLARTSPEYEPDMLISGIPGHQLARGQGQPSAASEAGYADGPPDVSAAIMNELDAGQQAIYEDLLVDDLLWWSEIIAQIEADFMKANPDGSPLEPAVIDDSGAGENLFDLLGQ